MLRRICIQAGEWVGGGYPSLRWALTHLDGDKIDQPASKDFYFTGVGSLMEGIICIAPKGPEGPVFKFKVASNPTEESAQFMAGFEFASKQRRRCRPGEQRHRAFIQGWGKCWEERRK